jgi:aspartyl-tRNA synthetase
MNRTHKNGELRIEHVGTEVTLVGWVQRKRNLGSLVFIDLRDRYGITQLSFLENNPLKDATTDIKSEYVLEVTGIVTERTSKNKDIPTGDIEINVTKLTILNRASQPPIVIQDDIDALEETRLKYRYLDLRRPSLQHNFIVRHKLTTAVRTFLNTLDFIEFETPILTKSTPEGARDYLVPSRIYPGEFFALPQSPQIFKQLLMVSGFERYYQIAKCFRDEDLRSDRQPEFTQIDIETSFMDQEAVLNLSEEMIKYVMKEVKGIELKDPFPRMTYFEAMDSFGTDKPDTRFDMKLIDVSSVVHGQGFKVFDQVLEDGGIVKAINVKDAASDMSRKVIDRYTAQARNLGAKGLAFMKYVNHSFEGGISKFFNSETATHLIDKLDVVENDILLFVSDSYDIVSKVLGALRNTIAKDRNLVNDDEFDFTWVIDWPMFEKRAEDGKFVSLHHPFTKVQEAYTDTFKRDPLNALAYCYDLVVHGQELGGGSVRIHDEAMQNQVFDVLGISKEEQQIKFGFLLDALKYGTPPHAGIAFGLDRFVMLLVGTENIRDVIAFPKTNSTKCLLTDAPSNVSIDQVNDLGLLIKS